MDLLRLVLDARRISAITATNALTIKDTPERVAAAARWSRRSTRRGPKSSSTSSCSKSTAPSCSSTACNSRRPGRRGIDGSVSVNPPVGTLTLQALRNLSQSDVLLANLPSLYYRLLKTDMNTRTLANPQLRTSDGTTAQARFGSRYRSRTTTFAPIATGGTPQQPITAFDTGTSASTSTSLRALTTTTMCR